MTPMTPMTPITPITPIILDAPISYADALRMQLERWEQVSRGDAPNTVFLLEHLHVITMGRDTKPEHVLHSEDALRAMGVELYKAERGGDATYHGPGQLVAYPILRLKDFNLGIRAYMRALEEVLIRTLDTYGVQGQRVEGLTGVWVDGAKVAACGVGIRRWTTFHGIALNINPNMDHFKLIVPCGIADRPVTTMKLLMGNAPKFEEVRERYLWALGEVFK